MPRENSGQDRVVEATCADCGCTTRLQGQRSINRGSSVRDPGEALCMSCTSKRTKMMRELDRLPSNLHDIRNMKRWTDVGLKPSPRFR